MARCIHLDLSKLRPSAWSYWQVVDGGRHGRGGSGWGLLEADLLNGTNLSVNPKYYVPAQYTRHIRPGMTAMSGGDATTIVVYSSDERRLSFVVFNDGPARVAHFDLGAFTLPDQEVASFLTSPKAEAEARYATRTPVILSKNRFETNLASDSVQSFELRNVSLP